MVGVRRFERGTNPTRGRHGGPATVVLAALALLFAALPAGANTVTVPDGPNAVGEYSSLVLDGNGFPVVAYHDATTTDLKVLRCDDPSCDGPGDSITTPDPAGASTDIGRFASLALDAAGNPVVAYFDGTNSTLKVLRCDDPLCDGTGESVTTPDPLGDAAYLGVDASLALNDNDHPVVAYHDVTGGDLRVLRCDDPTCDGTGETITTPDPAGAIDEIGSDVSLVLDAAGNPVVSYYQHEEGDLVVLHCDDPTCDGTGDSITRPDPKGQTDDVGEDTSLVLDDAGNPVVVYVDSGVPGLRLLHCDDPNCDGTESPVGLNERGRDPVLRLDEAGAPAIAFWRVFQAGPKVLRCDDPDCTGGGEIVAVADPDGLHGTTPSLALDGAGHPVLAYHEPEGADLRLVRCTDPTCATDTISNPAPGMQVRFPSLALNQQGYPVVAVHDATGDDLGLVVCNDPGCVGDDDHVRTLVEAGFVGHEPSLVLDAADNPVISHHDLDESDLMVFRCDDPRCQAGGERSTTPDSINDVGLWSSIALDAAGNPVIAYYDDTLESLKLMVCDDVACEGGNESITLPDPDHATLEEGGPVSLAIGPSGNPIVAYTDGTNEDLRVLMCNDPRCDGTGGDGDGNNTRANNPDPEGSLYALGGHPSLVLDAAGNPMIAYGDLDGTDLRFIACDDPGCADDKPVAKPDPAGATNTFAQRPSLAINSTGNPVIVYADTTDDVLRLVACNDRGCTGGDEAVVPALPGSDGGREPSLALDARDNPVVAFVDADGALRVVRCNDPLCGTTSPSAPTLVITASNPTPAQGEVVTLTATPHDPDEDTVADVAWTTPVTRWDLDGDGVFTDASGDTATLDTGALPQGEHTVTARHADDEGQVVVSTTTVVVGPPPTTGGGSSTPPPPPPPPVPLDPAEVEAATNAGDPVQAAIDLAGLRFDDADDNGFAQTPRTADFAVLARVDLFADALGGSALTGNAPLLFTPGDTLDPRTATELDRVLPPGGTVHLLGGTAALADGIADAITALGLTPNRLDGPSRVETALAIADHALTQTSPTGLLLARANAPTNNPTAAWADAITAGGLAADTGHPILLTPTNGLHPAVADWLADHPDLPVTALGGTAALTDNVITDADATRVQGANRYATATAVADLWPTASGDYLIANGTATDAWAFTLAAAGIAADLDQPTLLVDTDRLPPETDTHLCTTGTRANTTLIGSTRLIAQPVRDALGTAC